MTETSQVQPEAPTEINVSVAYAKAARQFWVKLKLDAGATAQDAIDASEVLSKFPEIDLEEQKIGVFGRAIKLNKKLEEGDRVEIYRPITADPEQVQRKDM